MCAIKARESARCTDPEDPFLGFHDRLNGILGQPITDPPNTSRELRLWLRKSVAGHHGVRHRTPNPNHSDDLPSRQPHNPTINIPIRIRLDITPSGMQNRPLTSTASCIY
jgi:hypothetical protein